MTRLSAEEYYMSIALQTSKRSTCARTAVGAVLVQGNNIISMGYNGSPKGEPHCIDEGCILENGHCIRTIHAEMNCLIKAWPTSEECFLYTSSLPCYICAGAIINAGYVSKVIYYYDYKDVRVELHGFESQIELLTKNYIDVSQVKFKGL